MVKYLLFEFKESDASRYIRYEVSLDIKYSHKEGNLIRMTTVQWYSSYFVIGLGFSVYIEVDCFIIEFQPIQ